MSYAESTGADDTYALRLMISRDGGLSYGDLRPAGNGIRGMRPASVIGDERGHVYVLHLDDRQDSATDRQLRFVKYGLENDYAGPVVDAVIPNFGSGHFTAHYDRSRRRIYYLTVRSAAESRPENLLVLGEEGQVMSQQTLTFERDGRGLHYPYIAMIGGDIYVAWTSWLAADDRYDSINAVRSSDGGDSWTRLDGSPLATPIDSTADGPADRIVLEDELGASSWLSRVTGHGGALHLFYFSGRFKAERQHYGRFEPVTQRWLRVHPRWGGARTQIRSLDGFFVRSAARIFAVGAGPGNAIVILKSDDNGESWSDFAMAQVPPGFSPYALDGHEELTAAGDIVGVLTASCVDRSVCGTTSSILSFKVPAH